MILFGCNGSNGMILLAMFYHELQNVYCRFVSGYTWSIVYSLWCFMFVLVGGFDLVGPTQKSSGFCWCCNLLNSFVMSS